ncbi:MAG: UDP-N-acetylmuramoyl-tripeptide--D-alanyl-D-alanine ligase [Eubacteriales bacterium]
MIAELKVRLTVKEIAERIGAKLIGNGNGVVGSITTDSREVKEGSLFVAIKGERLDGHDYIADCGRKGMTCALCQRVPTGVLGCTLLLVPDTLKALGQLAKSYKADFNPLTVAVTGSIGKTTTKEFIWSVLSEKYPTLKTEGNHNNQIGLPMTLLGIGPEHKAAVLEMGMSHFGEIDELSRMTAPNIAVITNIGTSHIENLGSREGIRNAKMEIVNGLQPGGVLILNGDEPFLAGVRGAYYVGMKNRDCDVFADNILIGQNGTAFDLVINGERIESIVIPALGEHNVLNAAIAYTVGLVAGMGEFEIRRGLKNYKTVGMRQNLFTSGDRVILEDCYNAAPESMIASLKVLSEVAKGRGLRPVAVLGEMRELGSYAEEGHRRVGRAVAENRIALLFTFGKNARWIAKSAIESGMPSEQVFVFEDLADAGALTEALISKTGKGDILLFKASRAIRLERVVEGITTDQKCCL